MANRNLDVFIQRPAYEQVTKVEFTEYKGGDIVIIPRRTPYANIKNLTKLKEDGFFRTKTTEVSTDYGGNNAKDGYTTLGLTLPRTEKLIMLIENKEATAVKVIFSGYRRAGVDATEYTIPQGLHTFDLYDLGLHIEDNEKGIATITVQGATTVKLNMILIARY